MAQKNALGKGLGAIFPDLLNNLDQKAPSSTCGIEELRPNRFQPRKTFNDEEQKKLVASIKTTGIIQPLIVRKAEKGYEIIAGERRWRAAQAAGLKDVPIVIREATDRDVKGYFTVSGSSQSADRIYVFADSANTALYI